MRAMIDPTLLRFTAMREFHIERGTGRLVAIMFQLAPASPGEQDLHSSGLCGANPLGVADDRAVGAAMPLQRGQQLLDGDQPQLACPFGGGGRLGDDGGHGSLYSDCCGLIEPVLHPVVDMARGRLALYAAGKLGLGAADGDGAL